MAWNGRTIRWSTAALLAGGTLLTNTPAAAEGGLTLEERVQRLDRYDSAKNDLFEKETRRSGSFRDDQHTVAAELSYVF